MNPLPFLRPGLARPQVGKKSRVALQAMACKIGQMPTKIFDLMQAEKELSAVPVWVERGADVLEFSTPIEIGGVTVEALILRGTARKPLADRHVTLQIEYHNSQIIGGATARMEWRPLNPHNNKGLGPKPLRYSIISCSHHHPFDLNWKQSQEDVLKGDLPIAVPLEPDPKNFRAFLAVVGKEFRISNIQIIILPPWQPRML